MEQLRHFAPSLCVLNNPSVMMSVKFSGVMEDTGFLLYFSTNSFVNLISLSVIDALSRPKKTKAMSAKINVKKIMKSSFFGPAPGLNTKNKNNQ